MTRAKSDFSNASSIRVLVWFTLNPSEELRIEVLMRKFGFKSISYTRSTLISMVRAGWISEKIIESLYCRGGVTRVYSAGPRLIEQTGKFPKNGHGSASEKMRQDCIDVVAMHGGSVEIEAAIRRIP